MPMTRSRAFMSPSPYDRRMLPNRADIAAPPFPPGTTWVGADPPAMERLTARGPVLVHFMEFAQLNSVRALPYTIALDDRYRDAGLTVLGVHSPRFPFTAEVGAMAHALGRLGVTHPVAADLDYAIWHDYGCEGWPSLFLWGRGGVLRWFHFGEGEYEETERAIQDELRSTNDAGSLPEPLPPIRPSDAPAAVVIAPTEEIFPGGEVSRPWIPSPAEPALELDYAAGGAAVSADGSGDLNARIDGEPVSLAVDGGGLYELSDSPVPRRAPPPHRARRRGPHLVRWFRPGRSRASDVVQTAGGELPEELAQFVSGPIGGRDRA